MYVKDCDDCLLFHVPWSNLKRKLRFFHFFFSNIYEIVEAYNVQILIKLLKIYIYSNHQWMKWIKTTQHQFFSKTIIDIIHAFAAIRGDRKSRFSRKLVRSRGKLTIYSVFSLVILDASQLYGALEVPFNLLRPWENLLLYDDKTQLPVKDIGWNCSCLFFYVCR